MTTSADRIAAAREAHIAAARTLANRTTTLAAMAEEGPPTFDHAEIRKAADRASDAVAVLADAEQHLSATLLRDT